MSLQSWEFRTLFLPRPRDRGAPVLRRGAPRRPRRRAPRRRERRARLPGAGAALRRLRRGLRGRGRRGRAAQARRRRRPRRARRAARRRRGARRRRARDRRRGPDRLRRRRPRRRRWNDGTLGPPRRRRLRRERARGPQRRLRRGFGAEQAGLRGPPRLRLRLLRRRHLRVHAALRRGVRRGPAPVGVLQGADAARRRARAPRRGLARLGRRRRLDEPEIFRPAVGGLRGRRAEVQGGAGKGRDIPNFKVSDLGRVPLVSADFWTSDHLSERSRSVDAFYETRARAEHSRRSELESPRSRPGPRSRSSRTSAASTRAWCCSAAAPRAARCSPAGSP